LRREHPPGLSCRVLRRDALQILSGGAGASYREILAKPAEWYSANMMALVAAMGAALARWRALWSITWTANCSSNQVLGSLTRSGSYHPADDRPRRRPFGRYVKRRLNAVSTGAGPHRPSLPADTRNLLPVRQTVPGLLRQRQVGEAVADASGVGVSVAFANHTCWFKRRLPSGPQPARSSR
jgi:hypothetical protein